MRRSFCKILVLAACAAICVTPLAHSAANGASGATGAKATAPPTAVEPKAGKPAAAPVDTTPPAAVTVVPAPQPTAAPVPAPGPTGATGPSGSQASGGNGLSGGALAAIACALLLVGIAALIAFAQWRGWSSTTLRRWRHAVGELNWRMSLRAAEFRDFLRLGR